MKVLTVSDFLEWQKGAAIKEYIFASDNQQGYSFQNVRTALHFDKSFACPELRQICFTGNKRDSLFFNGVKEVHMFDNKKSIGIVFDIICDGYGNKSFRMIAD